MLQTVFLNTTLTANCSTDGLTYAYVKNVFLTICVTQKACLKL